MFPCAVFGWFQDSFIGIEQESAYSLPAGYLKGAEQAGALSAELMLNVMTKFSNAGKQTFIKQLAVQLITFNIKFLIIKLISPRKSNNSV